MLFQILTLYISIIMKSPTIFDARYLETRLNMQTKTTTIDNKKIKIMLRPLNYEGLDLFFRIKCCWLVFTGKVDLIEWNSGDKK